jgi:hypothetical protein
MKFLAIKELSLNFSFCNIKNEGMRKLLKAVKTLTLLSLLDLNLRKLKQITFVGLVEFELLKNLTKLT